MGEALVQALSGSAQNSRWLDRLAEGQPTTFTRIAHLISPHEPVTQWNDYIIGSADKVRDRLITVAKELRDEGL